MNRATKSEALPEILSGNASGEKRIGLIAGWGKYPVVLARALRRQGYRVYCLGVWNHADPALNDYCEVFKFSGFGRFGMAFRFFRRHGVTRATMAGKIHKKLLFEPWFLFRQFPDWTTVRIFTPQFLTKRKDCKDDSLLLTVVDAFAEQGIRFLPGTDFAPELLVKKQQMTHRSPSRSQWKDILFGWKLAKEMGRLDVGQSVAVKNRAVLAVEAIEGTDACIARAGELCPSGDFTVVKVSKPRQDMRFDVPTFGLGTLETMIRAGARTLAVEAEKTIFIDQQKVVDLANEHRVCILALSEGDLEAEEAPNLSEPASRSSPRSMRSPPA
jgi:hypothetical protein